MTFDSLIWRCPCYRVISSSPPRTKGLTAQTVAMRGNRKTESRFLEWIDLPDVVIG